MCTKLAVIEISLSEADNLYENMIYSCIYMYISSVNLLNTQSDNDLLPSQW